MRRDLWERTPPVVPNLSGTTPHRHAFKIAVDVDPSSSAVNVQGCHPKAITGDSPSSFWPLSLYGRSFHGRHRSGGLHESNHLFGRANCGGHAHFVLLWLALTRIRVRELLGIAAHLRLLLAPPFPRRASGRTWTGYWAVIRPRWQPFFWPTNYVLFNTHDMRRLVIYGRSRLLSIASVRSLHRDRGRITPTVPIYFRHYSASPCFQDCCW